MNDGFRTEAVEFIHGLDAIPEDEWPDKVKEFHGGERRRMYLLMRVVEDLQETDPVIARVSKRASEHPSYPKDQS